MSRRLVLHSVGLWFVIAFEREIFTCIYDIYPNREGYLVAGGKGVYIAGLRSGHPRGAQAQDFASECFMKVTSSCCVVDTCRRCSRPIANVVAALSS